MSEPAKLPGFYYDQSKKKYFRILPHHAAPASSSFYTATTVRKAEEKHEASAVAAFEFSQALARRRHSPLASNPNVRVRLHRELGVLGPVKTQEDRRRFFSKGLQSDVVLSYRRSETITAFAIGEVLPEEGQPYLQESRAGGSGEVESGDTQATAIWPTRPASSDRNTHFDHDPVLNHRTVYSLPPSSWTSFNRSGENVGHHHSNISSVTISPYPSSLLLSTDLGERNDPVVTIYNQVFHSGSSRTRPLAFTLNLYNVPSVWTSTCASSPILSNTQFALGTTNRVILLEVAPERITTPHVPTSSDIFALAYQHSFTPPSSSYRNPSNPGHFYTLLAGSRDGSVRLYDTRLAAPKDSAARGQMVIKHGSAVTHIRMLDTDGINVCVNGLSKTAVFDLRFPHVGSPMREYVNETKEVLIIGEDMKTLGSKGRVTSGGRERADLGFDVEPVRGIVARADDSFGDPRTGLWSLDTGKKLATLEESQNGAGKARSAACRGLKFDTRDERSGLWKINGNTVEWWGL
ncbi:hypothetical protein EX30DRAFT_351579 [Ascodesmis nigricans]|uniref:WD40 repeat-like protein n=1 Tax=Ascodesmis nigricans TaxID=341454 RepID=A0A4S2MQT5_9PEZI|nr:hypothetical protein EX30DRAFT_351579 [Ascodesmis nigricans]